MSPGVSPNSFGEFDYDLFHYYGQNEVDIPSAPIEQHEATDPLAVWNGTTEAVIAESSHVQLLAVPQIAPRGFLSAKLVVRTKNATDVISTFHGLDLSGDLHQASNDFGFGPSIWGGGVDQFGNPELARVDTHLLLQERDRSFGNGRSRPFEGNDASNPVGLAMLASIGVVPEIEAVFGLGDLSQEFDISIFAIRPDSQANQIEVAQIVTPAVMPGTGETGQVFVRLGVLGGTDERVPFDDYPVFGQEEPVSFPLFAAPCDFDTDGVCNATDLAQLESALGTTDTQFDLDQSGGVDGADLNLWFEWFAQQNGLALTGDADLDGDVDALDLNRLGIHWLMPSAGWSGGDFNADGVTDAADLNQLGLNWQRGVVSSAAVPETNRPMPILLVCGLLAVGYQRRFEMVRKGRVQMRNQ